MSARVIAVSLSFFIFLLNGGYAFAQYNRPGGGRQNGAQATPFSKSGTVEGMNAGNLIISAGGQKYMVGVSQQTEIHVTGTAEPEYLAPKMFVEFVADVSEKGDGKDKISKMTICTASSDRPAGLSAPLASESSSADDDKKADKNKDAAPPDSGTKAQADAPAGSKKGHNKTSDSPFDQGVSGSSKSKHASIEKLPGTFTVRGMVKSFKSPKLIVTTGRGPQIKVDIAETAVIKVEMSDLHNVSSGDKVTVKGNAIQNRVLADSISVELSNPLTGVKKKSTHFDKPSKAVNKAPAKEEPKTDGN